METDFRPLYSQVRDVLRGRVAKGDWRPGDCLPSEHALASELGVSQGTVRKALDALAAENVLERRQGRGTFVAKQTPERSLFHFFRMTDCAGDRVTPEPVTERIGRGTASAEERDRLSLDRDAAVHRIERVRAIGGRPSSVERIIVPSALTPDLAARAPLPNALYAFYQAVYGVSVTRAEEWIRAEAASVATADALGVAPGAALLRVDRVAFDLEDRAVELRESRFLTGDIGYAVALK